MLSNWAQVKSGDQALEDSSSMQLESSVGSRGHSHPLQSHPESASKLAQVSEPHHDVPRAHSSHVIYSYSSSQSPGRGQVAGHPSVSLRGNGGAATPSPFFPSTALSVSLRMSSRRVALAACLWPPTTSGSTISTTNMRELMPRPHMVDHALPRSTPIVTLAKCWQSGEFGVQRSSVSDTPRS